MAILFTNNAYSTLAAAITTAGQTSVTVQTGHGDRFPVVAGSDVAYVTLENTGGTIEIIKITARAAASDVLTVTRGEDNTVATTWAIGDVIELRNPAITHEAMIQSGGPLGTPSSGTATNLTGLPIATGVANLGTGVATFLTTPSSANLLAALTNETGTGAAVFGTNPTITNPVSGSQTLSDGATINWNMNSGQVATVTLAGNRTLNAPTNLKVGFYVLHVRQDGTGTRLLTWNAVFKWVQAVAPVLTTTASRRDTFSFVCDGTNLYGSYLPDVR